MTLNIVLPVVSGSNVTSKDVVISLLAYDQPLTAKKIHSNAKRKYGLAISYQAVHKTLIELLEKGIIEKKGKEYELDLNWINSLKKFTEQTLSKENKTLTLVEAINKGISDFYFDDLASVDRFLMSSSEAGITKGEDLYMYWFHSWTPLFFSKEGYSKIKDLAESANLYVLVKGDSALDNWCGQVLKKFGQHNFKTGIKDLNVPEFLVYQDYIFQVFYPKKIIEEVNREFDKVEKIEDLDIDKLFTNVFEKKVGIPLIINKNKVVAEQLKNKMKSYFE